MYNSFSLVIMRLLSRQRAVMWTSISSDKWPPFSQVNRAIGKTCSPVAMLVGMGSGKQCEDDINAHLCKGTLIID